MQAVTQLRDLVRTYDDVLSSATCEEVVRLFDASPALHRRQTVAGADGAAGRQSTFVEMYTHEIASFRGLEAELGALTGRRVADYVRATGYPLSASRMRAFKIKRYLPNGQEEFPLHVDITRTDTMDRMLALFWYLNDVAEGGETEFPHLGVAVRPRRGRMLIFPPMWMFPHAGRPPRSGPKYIIGSYLAYVDRPSRWSTEATAAAPAGAAS